MPLIRPPHGTKFDFLGKRAYAIALTTAIILGSIASLATQGLNFGIDFAGGILIEVKTPGPANLSEMRSTLSKLGMGVELQGVGGTTDEVMIRVQRQEGDEKAQLAALAEVKGALGEGVEYRRTEVVGPKVGDELRRDAMLAATLSIIAIAAYIWLRFEWQFALGALIAIFHDVIATFGIFSLLQLPFDLTVVAAILTIAGYSINDTVVIYDRVRENLRKYKKMSLIDLLNLSANETLSRTIITGVTTLLAVLSLYILGGEVLKGFSFAMIFGIVIGTYSSIYVAVPALIYFKLRTSGQTEDEADAEQPAAG